MYTNDAGLEVNMYDCTVCPSPKCRSRYRWPEGDPVMVRCDECDYAEPWTTANGRPK